MGKATGGKGQGKVGDREQREHRGVDRGAREWGGRGRGEREEKERLERERGDGEGERDGRGEGWMGRGR